jgi:putative DNA primase/helicase
MSLDLALDPPLVVIPSERSDVKRRTLHPATRAALQKENADVAPSGISEDSLALEFVERMGADYRYSPGMEWMHNEGAQWARDEHLTRFEAARQVVREASTKVGERDRIRLESAKTVAAVLTLAQSDGRIMLPANVWDADPLLLNTPDGLIDLRTGKPVPDAGHYVTQTTRVSPEPDLPCPLWSRFVDAVFLGDREMVGFVQRLLGYLLTGDRGEQKLFFFYGLGANGKSTLMDLVLWLMGSYGLKLPAGVLMQSAIERHPTELAQLRGKRLAMSSELDEGQFWAESRIKELTGDDVLTARFMRQDFFEFRMTQTHVIVGNYKPRLRGGDAALARRFVLVPFLAKFEGAGRDPDMLKKLRAEGPAILQWMIDGAVTWHSDGLNIPATVSAASADYMSDNDDVAVWIDECCTRYPDASAKANSLYESFAHWIKARGQHAASMRLWGDRMATIQGLSKKQSNGVRYVGIALTDSEQARQQAAEQGGWR